MDLEYVYLDILNDVNMNASVMEVQPTCDTNNGLKGNLLNIITIFQENQLVYKKYIFIYVMIHQVCFFYYAVIQNQIFGILDSERYNNVATYLIGK